MFEAMAPCLYNVMPSLGSLIGIIDLAHVPIGIGIAKETFDL